MEILERPAIADREKMAPVSDELDETYARKQQQHPGKTQARHRPLREAEPAVAIDEHACHLLPRDSETNGGSSADRRSQQGRCPVLCRYLMLLVCWLHGYSLSSKPTTKIRRGFAGCFRKTSGQRPM